MFLLSKMPWSLSFTVFTNYITPKYQTLFIFCLQAEQVISSLRRDDEVKRTALSKIFQDAQKTMEALDDYVINHLISEGTINDLQDDMTKYINNLETNECPILVAGECYGPYVFSLR